MDETPAPVLDLGRGKTKRGYFWALARGDRRWNGPESPGVAFTYAPGRSGEHTVEILQGFDGILQVDGSAGYSCLFERSDPLPRRWPHRDGQQCRQSNAYTRLLQILHRF